MEHHVTNFVSQSRREELMREAVTARLVNLVRRSRSRHPRTEPRPAPRPGDVRRSVTA